MDCVHDRNLGFRKCVLHSCYFSPFQGAAPYSSDSTLMIVPSPTQTRNTLLATVVTDSGHEILEILFVLQTGVVVNIVTDLALEDFLRGKWLDEKNRIIISHDELECVRVR